MSFDPTGLYVPCHERDEANARANVAEDRARMWENEARRLRFAACDLGVLLRNENANYQRACEAEEAAKRCAESAMARCAALLELLRRIGRCEDGLCALCNGCFCCGHAADCELAALLEEVAS